MNDILKALIKAYAELSDKFCKDPNKCNAYRDAVEAHLANKENKK